MARRGTFITFEGSEGAGKTTQIERLEAHLAKRYAKGTVLCVREPGGVNISESIRKILLDVNNGGMSDACETLLYLAARAQLVHEVLRPALSAGGIVIADRYMDSTVAYQGYGNGVDMADIAAIGTFATGGLRPDLTLLLDMDVTEAFARRSRLRDRIEQRELEYHEQVRRGYLKLAKQEPGRIKVIDATRSKDAIFNDVTGYVDALLENR